MPVFKNLEKKSWGYFIEPSLGKIPNQENKRDYFLVSSSSFNEKTIAVFKELEHALEIIKILEAHSYEQLKLNRKNIDKDQVFYQDNQMFIQLNETETLPIWSEVNSIVTEEILKTHETYKNSLSNSLEQDLLNSENELFLYPHHSKFDIFSQILKNKITSLFCCMCK
ncbi:MAG: hypothetical protein Q8K60_02375 [Parachlamydiaceae bacterium]|nr:hypothetical protein [Parachlamydiaceae bacterium]